MRRVLVAVVAAAVAASVTTAPARAAAPLSMTVTSAGDLPDTAINGICATADHTCTLRAAIQEASAYTGGPALIDFALPAPLPATIQLSSRLPAINNPAGVTIDGYSQPGSRPNNAPFGSNAVLGVQVRGQGAGGFAAFYVTGPGNVIRGLSIFNAKYAILAQGAGATRNAFVGDFICTDAAGRFTAGAVNGGAGGIVLNTGPSSNTIGISQAY